MAKYFVEYKIEGCAKIWKHTYESKEILERVMESLSHDPDFKILSYGQERI